MMERLLGKKVLYLLPGAKNYVENFSDRPMPLYPYVWGSDQFWAELVQPGRTSKPCVARGVVI